MSVTDDAPDLRNNVESGVCHHRDTGPAGFATAGRMPFAAERTVRRVAKIRVAERMIRAELDQEFVESATTHVELKDGGERLAGVEVPFEEESVPDGVHGAGHEPVNDQRTGGGAGDDGRVTA